MRNIKQWLIVLAGLMLLLAPIGSWAQGGSAPEITSIEFPKQVDAGSRAEGRVCFKDPDGDVILAQFAVLAGRIEPFTLNNLQVEGKPEGCFSFPLTAPTTTQRVSMLVVLTDKAGNTSQPKNFSFDVIQTALLEIRPDTLSFVGGEGGSNPVPQTIQFRSVGSNPLEWLAQTDASWLQLNSSRGSLAAGQNVDVGVTAMLVGLRVGRYQARITVTAQGAQGSPAIVDVFLTVAPRSVILEISPPA